MPMQVLWTIRNQVVDSTFKVLPSGKIRNDFRLKSLERSLWMVPVTCLAAKNINSTHQPFLVTAVQLDLFCLIGSCVRVVKAPDDVPNRLGAYTRVG
ncbi:uncharacterized protein TNCT_203261 [Trichonephila clavata]|uniref:Uncharacterized protein n=1 Tax=Trichonephila clavata TaxID=2740835 RepID=A0A8X6FLV2_TRICU|nr:uncharacterized protein TNCT_203261 [Trichonephila clavata]